MKYAVVTVMLLGACGSDPPVCARPDLPNCGLNGHTVVKWQFDHYPEWQFPFDSCTDFMVNKVHVDAQAADGTVTTLSDDCGAGQVTFDGLPEGDYNVFVAPTDFGGSDLISNAASGTIAAGTFGADTMTTINVPYTSWLGTHTGQFLFRLTWGGQSCALATPTPVVTQVITLTSNGIAINDKTEPNMQKLDGTDPKPCFALEENFPQSAVNLPFGPAQLTVVGKDASDVILYNHTFDTFIGAGISNPTITFDLPAM